MAGATIGIGFFYASGAPLFFGGPIPFVLSHIFMGSVVCSVLVLEIKRLSDVTSLHLGRWSRISHYPALGLLWQLVL